MNRIYQSEQSFVCFPPLVVTKNQHSDSLIQTDRTPSHFVQAPPNNTLGSSQQIKEPMSYQFTTDWFANAAKTIWDQIIPIINPTKILEIGSYEGASTCYLIDSLGSKQDIEVHCIDTWEGGIEHKSAGTDMSSVEERFLKNTQLSSERATHSVNLQRHKGYSDLVLSTQVRHLSAQF